MGGEKKGEKREGRGVEGVVSSVNEAVRAWRELVLKDSSGFGLLALGKGKGRMRKWKF